MASDEHPQLPRVVLPRGVETEGDLSVTAYQTAAAHTDIMDAEDMPILGLFGEVGSLLATVKKRRRDRAAYWKYDTVIAEDVGDVLWLIDVNYSCI
jgi:hypothetical protein